MPLRSNPDTVTLDDMTFVEGGTTDNSFEVNDTEYTTVYYKEFDKGEGWALGQGAAANQTDAVGRIYGEFDEDTGTDISAGSARFAVFNRQNNYIRTIRSFSLGQIARGSGDRDARQPFPVQERDDERRPRYIAYPFRIALQLKVSSGTANVDNAEAGTTAEIDILRLEQSA